MMKELSIEADHPLVFMPLHENRPVLAADTKGMKHTSRRNKHYFQALLAKPHAPVQILAMQKISVIPQSNIVNGFTFNHHAGTGNRFYGFGACRQGKMTQIKVVKKLWPTVVKTTQAKSADKGSPGSRHRPPSTPLLCSIGIEEQTTHHAHGVIRLKNSQHFRNRARLQQTIGIKK